MPETNEILEQAAREIPAIRVPATAAAVVVPLALYGAQDLARKAVSRVQTSREERKLAREIRKAEEQQNATQA
jgi:hypothetical protein